MQHSTRLSLSLASSAALALASLPLAIRPLQAQEAPAPAAEPEAASTEAADLGVMGVNLKDAVKFNWGFQGALQGAGTPNEAGIGAFIPLKVGDNSVFFLDTLANVNFSDFSGYSSIINTEVEGATVSTSTRLGYRWLNKNRSWMFGVNAGYDSRPMATGGTDNGVNVTDSTAVFFQQVALNLEAVSNKWFTSAYLLYPIGEYGYNKMPAKINSYYYADSVMTAGVDAGYNLTRNLKASVGYYYSEGDLGAANGNSVRGRLEYNIANGLTSGINIAYDPAFSEGYSSGEFYKTLNLSVDLKWRFGANGYGAPSIRKKQPVVMPVIQALSTTPANRDVRVHDYQMGPFKVDSCWAENYDQKSGKWQGAFVSWNCDDGISATAVYCDDYLDYQNCKNNWKPKTTYGDICAKYWMKAPGSSFTGYCWDHRTYPTSGSFIWDAIPKSVNFGDPLWPGPQKPRPCRSFICLPGDDIEEDRSKWWVKSPTQYVPVDKCTQMTGVPGGQGTYKCPFNMGDGNWSWQGI